MKKEDSLNQSNKALNFWLCGGLLAILLVCTLGRDIDRPFYGLHSWVEASTSWVIRSHIKYGLGYTKGLCTWAVGDPPAETPNRYYDHPQLNNLLCSVFYRVFGLREQSFRIMKIVFGIISLFLFLRILKELLDHKTALLAGLFYVLFPLTAYFGTGGWLFVLGLWAFWCYLTLIGVLNKGCDKKVLHKWGLGVSLFLFLQVTWSGFFFALAIGVHYVFRCIHKRQMPEMSLLAILIIAPLSSLMVSLAIMAAGHGWDVQKVIELYKWRSAKGEMPEFLWGAWFAKFWEFAVTNFTLPILLTTIIYLTLGQLYVFASGGPLDKQTTVSRRFPQFWLFLMPGVFQLLILRGGLWRHQAFELPFLPFIAISTALAVMLLAELLKKINRHLAVAGMAALVAVFVGFCIAGTNYYYGIRWQSPAKIKMFKMLNQKIPPDQYLLSFDPFIVNQHKSKGGFYRPEIAWYLDREIVPARVIKDRIIMVAETLKDIEQKAKTGKYPYYLIPRTEGLMPLINQLTERYKYQYIPGDPGETKNGKFYRAGMMSYMIFDLSSKMSSP